MRQLALALLSLVSAVKWLANWRLLLPVLCVALLQFLTLTAIVNFHRAPLSGVLVPLIRALHGEGAVHYPQLYIALPALFHGLGLVLAATVEVYLWGVAILLFARQLGVADADAWVAARGRWPRLFLVQLPVVVLASLFIYGPALLWRESPAPGLQKALALGVPLTGVLVQSLFLLAPVAVLLERRSALSAIGRSFQMWRSNLIAVLVVVLIPMAFQWPFGYLYQRSPAIVRRFSPETMAALVSAEILVALFTGFVLIAAATQVFVARRAEA